MQWKLIAGFIFIILVMLIFAVMYGQDSTALLNKITGIGIDIFEGGPNEGESMEELRGYVRNLAEIMDKVHKSPASGCFFEIPERPSEFEGLLITISSDPNPNTPATIFGLKTGLLDTQFGRVNGIEPCAVVNYDAQYAFHNKWRFDMDPPQPEQSNNIPYDEISPVLISENGKIVASREFGEYFPYLYKPNANHVCFIPMEKVGGWIGSACRDPFIIMQSGKTAYGIDSDCEDKLLAIAEQNICGV